MTLFEQQLDNSSKVGSELLPKLAKTELKSTSLSKQRSLRFALILAIGLTSAPLIAACGAEVTPTPIPTITANIEANTEGEKKAQRTYRIFKDVKKEFQVDNLRAISMTRQVQVRPTGIAGVRDDFNKALTHPKVDNSPNLAGILVSIPSEGYNIEQKLADFQRSIDSPVLKNEPATAVGMVALTAANNGDYAQALRLYTDAGTKPGIDSSQKALMAAMTATNNKNLEVAAKAQQEAKPFTEEGSTQGELLSFGVSVTGEPISVINLKSELRDKLPHLSEETTTLFALAAIKNGFNTAEMLEMYDYLGDISEAERQGLTQEEIARLMLVSLETNIDPGMLASVAPTATAVARAATTGSSTGSSSGTHHYYHHPYYWRLYDVIIINDSYGPYGSGSYGGTSYRPVGSYSSGGTVTTDGAYRSAEAPRTYQEAKANPKMPPLSNAVSGQAGGSGAANAATNRAAEARPVSGMAQGTGDGSAVTNRLGSTMAERSAYNTSPNRMSSINTNAASGISRSAAESSINARTSISTSKGAGVSTGAGFSGRGGVSAGGGGGSSVS